MTEDDARAWIVARFGPDAVAPLDIVVAMIRDEASRQNLISAASMNAIWTRHIVDSAQLLTLPSGAGLWIDVGTGAGFPGIVTASLSDRRTLLVEPRRRRVDFLRCLIAALDLERRVEVRQCRIETVHDTAGTISARAVASIDTVLTAAASCSTSETRWLLPKGRHAAEQVAQAKKAWHGTFHVEQSITDPESLIVVASGVSRR